MTAMPMLEVDEDIEETSALVPSAQAEALIARAKEAGPDIAELAIRAKAEIKPIVDDAHLARVDAIRTDANKSKTWYGKWWNPKTTFADRYHKMLTAARDMTMSEQEEIMEACDRVMKPYIRARDERKRQEAARKEAAIRKEQEERREAQAKLERQLAKERADREREEAQRQAAAIEAEATRKAEELFAQGKNDEALASIDEADTRKQNILEDGEQTAAAVMTEGNAIAEEIASAPLPNIVVEIEDEKAPTSKTPAKKQKADRTNANKARAIIWAGEQLSRDNNLPVGWFDLNWSAIDRAVKDQGPLFPSAEECGISTVEDLQIRSARS